MKIILASGSPRRYDLLKQMGWQAEVCSLPFAEAETAADAQNRFITLRKRFSHKGENGLRCVNDKTSDAATAAKTAGADQSNGTDPVFSEKDLVLLSPYRNADLVCAYNALGKGKAAALAAGTERPVLSADTIVVLEDLILGKPADGQDAGRMLRLLSGRAHQVKTAVAVQYLDKTLLQTVTTEVHFRPLTEAEISWYVRTGEPLDKAGAYGIQGKGAVLVERIEGSYDNVVGLPLTAVYEMFLRLNIPV